MQALAALRLEIDITPRWFDLGAHFFADACDILRAIADSESKLLPFLQDVRFGTTGVRAVLGVPPGANTTAIEAERLKLVGILDTLDSASPRRLRATKARQAAQAPQGEAAPAPATEIAPALPEAAGDPAAAA